MNEEDPSLRLSINGEPFDATRHNTTVYTFYGSLALYNHVFIQTGEDGERLSGAYIFCDTPVYEPITTHADANDWPMILNRNEVAACDVEAWSNAHLQDLGDFIPEDWNAS